VRESDGTVRYVVDENAAKKLGSYVNPPLETHPLEPESTGTAVASRGKQQPKSAPAGGANYAVAAAESRPAPAPARADTGGGITSLFASTNDSRQDGVFDRMKNSVGRLFGTDDDKPSSPAAAAKPTAAPKPAARPQPAPVAAQARPQPAPQEKVEPAQTAQAAPAPTPARQSAASGSSLMSGAAPTVPTGSFNSRWGGIQ